MNLLEKLIKQIADEEIQPKATLQDWLDTLDDDHLEELERLITQQEEDPENEENEVLGQLVAAIYSIETDSIGIDEDGELKLADIEEDEFFNLVNSFFFLMPFYYWLKQDLIKVSDKISLLNNQKNNITVTLTEYGK